jgi:hypothetical protein
MKKEIDLLTGSVVYKSKYTTIIWTPMDTDRSVYTIDRVIVTTPFEDGFFTIVVPLRDLYLHSKVNLRKVSSRIAEALVPVVLLIRSGLTNRKELVTVIKQILDQMCFESCPDSVALKFKEDVNYGSVDSNRVPEK